MRAGISRPLFPTRYRLLHSRPYAPCPPIALFPNFSPSRTLANVRSDHDIFLNVAFNPAPSLRQEPEPGQRPEHPPPDERTVKLGKTLRILQSRLPNLLASPLPQEILSPTISLHLFPSTHPHLPTVSGRVAYHAALWTSPITWGRVPLVGNVNLEILSERMVKNPPSLPHLASLSEYNKRTTGEKLIVRWRTCGKTKGLGTGGNYKGIGARQKVDKITNWLGGDERRDDSEFCGLFIFEFDEEGRISNHVIERAEGGEGWDSGVGRVVSLTDWLLGKLSGKEKDVQGLALGYCDLGDRRDMRRRRPGARGSFEQGL